MNLPRTLFVGPMKCGTSWIQDYLDSRGDVCLPNNVKEVFYFDRHFQRGITWYQSFFKHYDKSTHSTTAEVAPSLYHCDEKVIESIRKQLGDIPIIITARDPIKRAWSHYLHMSRGYTDKPLQKAIEIYPEIIEGSRYTWRTAIWRKYFTEVTVLYQENLSSNPIQFCNEIDRLLNLPTLPNTGDIVSRKSNESTAPRSFVIAKLGRYCARYLRYMGFYKLVNLAKHLGLKRFFYGSPSSSNHSSLKPSDQEILLLQSYLKEESHQYQNKIASHKNEYIVTPKPLAST